MYKRYVIRDNGKVIAIVESNVHMPGLEENYKDDLDMPITPKPQNVKAKYKMNIIDSVNNIVELERVE